MVCYPFAAGALSGSTPSVLSSGSISWQQQLITFASAAAGSAAFVAAFCCVAAVLDCCRKRVRDRVTSCSVAARKYSPPPIYRMAVPVLYTLVHGCAKTSSKSASFFAFVPGHSVSSQWRRPSKCGRRAVGKPCVPRAAGS